MSSVFSNSSGPFRVFLRHRPNGHAKPSVSACFSTLLLQQRQQRQRQRQRPSHPIAPLARKPHAHNPFSTTTPMASSSSASSQSPSSPQISFSKSQPSSLPQLTHQLLQTTSWTLTPTNDGLAKSYTFPTFGAAIRFFERVAVHCESENHHPEWRNVYRTVDVVWTTHRPKGLSAKDVRMATVCDEVAGELGGK